MVNTKERKFTVSELITNEEIDRWKNGDVITIKAGTGTGKSYFIKNKLYLKAKKENKKILFLIHRVNTVNQFNLEIEKENKSDIIHIRTYQSLDTLYNNHYTFNFNNYQYIVCDEFHYFMHDAKFNKITDLSLKAILDRTDKIRIFMSATGLNMTKYIKNIHKIETIDYEIPQDYKFIRSLTFYKNDDTLIKFIYEAIKNKDKAIFFIESAEKAYNLYSKFQEYCLFNCSKSNKRFYQYVNQQKIDQMLQNERFDDLLLITTTCLDAGVNIIDPDLKHIVCDVKDTETLIQCVGRKRILNKDDYINLYIKIISNQQLAGKKTQLNKKIEKAQYLRNHTVEEYIRKYPRQIDQSQIVYTDVAKNDKNKAILKINKLMYFKTLLDLNEIDQIFCYENGYSDYIADIFQKSSYRLLHKEYEKNSLEQYLESIKGKVMLTKNDRKELIEKINLKQDGRLLKSIDSLNAALREMNIDYYIKQFQTSRIINGKKRNYKNAWKIMKLTD